MRSVGVIGAALIAASALGVVLLGLVARWLTLDQNEAFLAIWGVIFSGGSVLSVIEQETARQVTVAKASQRPVPASVGQLTLIALGGALVVLVGLVLLPASVFGTNLWLVAFTFVAFSGFAVQYLTRGVLLGRQRNSWYALVIFAEAALRLVAIVVLLGVGVKPTVEWAVAAVVLGSFGWLPAVKQALAGIDWRQGREPWRTAAGRIAALALANGLLATVMTGYPATVSTVLGSDNGLAIFFAIVSLSRIPLVLLSPVQALVVPTTTRAILAGRANELLRTQAQLLGGIVVVGLLAAAGGWVLGPWAVRLVFGPDYIAAPAMVALLLGVTVVMAGALLQAAVFVSLERYRLMVATWGAAAGGAVIALLVSGGPAEIRGAAGFVTASVVGYLLSTVLLRSALGKATQLAADPNH